MKCKAKAASESPSSSSMDSCGLGGEPPAAISTASSRYRPPISTDLHLGLTLQPCSSSSVHTAHNNSSPSTPRSTLTTTTTTADNIPAYQRGRRRPWAWAAGAVREGVHGGRPHRPEAGSDAARRLRRPPRRPGSHVQGLHHTSRYCGWRSSRGHAWSPPCSHVSRPGGGLVVGRGRTMGALPGECEEIED